MQDDPLCAICQSHAWEVFGHRTFARSDRAASPYIALRMRVLFELWAPERDPVTLRWVLCERCGFVTYLPRATVEDLDRKYRFLAAEEPRAEGPAEPTPLDRTRSAELLAAFGSHLPQSGTLLDFGGGNGALCVAFAERGFQCAVVDYVTQTVAGVARLGDTLDDLAPAQSFDVVVCSHVIEHVADPLATVRRLRAVVRDGGVLCVAVPMELRGGPPKMAEPVTHVSFFCESSMSALLTTAGLHIEMLKTAVSTSSSGTPRRDVLAVARRNDAAQVDAQLRGCDEARALLRPRGLHRYLESAVSWWKAISSSD